MNHPTLTPTDYSAECTRLALAYIDGVLDGSIVAGELVRKGVQRHVQDLKTGKKRGLVFEPERAQRVYKFFAYLRHWKGEYDRQQFRMAAWQAFIIWCLFGWTRADTGARRFSEAYVQLAKKNGKTELAGGIGLYMFAADGESGAEVFSVATKRDQAKLSHVAAVEMRKRSPELVKRIEAYKDNLSIPLKACKFVPIGSNTDTTDGIEPHCALIDELHRHRTPDLYDVIKYGMVSRRQPLLFGITTAGSNVEGVCYTIREQCIAVLTGALQMDQLFAFVAEPDKDDDWQDESTWAKGNPNLGVSVHIEQLREDAQSAAHMPAKLANFKRYRLNQWVTGAADSWMNMDLWNACPAVRLALERRTCWGGLDLAATQDIAAFALYFPAEGDEPHAVLPFFFVPELNVPDLEKQYRIPLQAWVNDGWVKATPGNVIDYAYIRHAINTLSGMYNITDVGYDDWNATQIVLELLEDGVEMVAMQQTIKTYNAPMTELEDLVAAGNFCHAHAPIVIEEGDALVQEASFGPNPVLRWMAGNVRAASDPSGRKKPMKREGKRRHKIDGIVALLMAIGRYMESLDDEDSESVYETRGVRTLG